MTMTPDEIYADYRDAKDKTAQIGIMAELNLCTKHEIIKILEDMGVDPSKDEVKPKKRTYRKRAKAEEGESAKKPKKTAVAPVQPEEQQATEMPTRQQAIEKPARQQAMPAWVRDKMLERMTELSEQIDTLGKELKELDDYMKGAEIDA